MQVDIKINISLPLRELGWPHIDDKASVSDINTSCNDVSGTENTSLFVSEPGHDVFLFCDFHLDLLAIFILLGRYDTNSQLLEIL